MNGSRTLRSTGRGLLLATSLLLPAAATQAAGPETLTLHQTPFETFLHDRAGDGMGPGDLTTWIAPVVARDGRLGVVLGEHHTVALPTDGPHGEMRIGTSMVDLGNGDRIALAGLVPVVTPGGSILPGTEIVNAVIGGTGAFLAARGEIRSVPAEDGSWEHALTFVTAGPDDPAQDLRMTMTWVASGTGVIDMNGDGVAEAGDLRVFHLDGSTADGRPVDARGAQKIVAGTGADGSVIRPLGYAVYRIEGDLLVGLITPTVASGTGEVAEAPPPAPIVGGTGRFAGSRGWYTLEIRPDDVAPIFPLYGEPADVAAQTLVLHSAVEPVMTVDMGDAGGSVGDMSAWSLALTDAAGAPAGDAYGYATTIGPADDGSPDRILNGLIAIALADGSSLIVADLHPEEASVPNAMETAVTRPVIGGTGAYAGASGELVTTRDGAGVLVHTFTLRLPGA